MDLLTRMLCKNPVNRITIEDAYKHSWFFHDFTEENDLIHLETYANYDTKEQLSTKITNFMLNTMTYTEISNAKAEIDKTAEETITVAQLEHVLNTKFKVNDECTLINAKKIMQEAL